MEKVTSTIHKKQISAGLLAHVDAGKTTLAESILYLSGKIRSLGRVDHQDAFFDHFELERSRGITIFSKQAEVPLPEMELTLLDTPGHIDFSAEMERTLQVIDYGILVISGSDGVQGHVKTLWKLLDRYHIPVFLFINKMDQPDNDAKEILQSIQKQLHSMCIDFTVEDDAFFENVSMSNENMLEQYLEGNMPSVQAIQAAIQSREIFPCYFGSALKLDGIEAFLHGLEKYTVEKHYKEEFGAKIYKIAKDAQGNRLTYMKLTGGRLRVKTEIKDKEKIDQIRIYSGDQYHLQQEVHAGEFCAVTGLTTTKIGEGLGVEEDSMKPFLQPVLTYQILLQNDCDPHQMYLKLKQLEEEDPELRITWNEANQEIHAQVMGDVQIEILKKIIEDRFHENVDFGTGSIVYEETIADKVEGAGHFEPLRHYAEVRLLLEPLPRGSGMQYETDCSEDVLDRNWQRLILTHMAERTHPGVLTGSTLTDVKITLKTGRAHLKHTEGGDFRQATYRAIRQGLKKAESILLEPFYEFELEIPSNVVGRAMSDLQRLSASFDGPHLEGDTAFLYGTGPVSTLRDYQREVVAYTKGAGRFTVRLKGYDRCVNEEEVIEQIGYHSDADMENPCGSVFCSHGAGFYVNWDEVEEYMHTDSIFKKETVHQPYAYTPEPFISEEELNEIFERTYGPIKRDRNKYQKARTVEFTSTTKRQAKPVQPKKEYLLVDGYNIIFAWEDLKELSKINMEAARDKLIDILCNYQGYKKCTLILVFDAYKVPGHVGEMMKYHNIHVVYTKEAETADQYIEKTVHEIAKDNRVIVATSDGLEQLIIMGAGAFRLSAKGLLEEILSVSQEIRREYLERTSKKGNYLFDNVNEETKNALEEIQKGQNE